MHGQRLKEVSQIFLIFECFLKNIGIHNQQGNRAVRKKKKYKHCWSFQRAEYLKKKTKPLEYLKWSGCIRV